MTIVDYLLVTLAALAAGLVNALAGGGTLITFPVLVAVLPNFASAAANAAIAANVTSTVALCPGYFGATFAQSKDLKGQKRRMWLVVPAAVIGGLIGGMLLLISGEKLFRSLVPFLILLASGLLAVQDPVRKWLTGLSQHQSQAKHRGAWVMLPVGLAAIYGGYFGAGVSVIILAVLGLVLEDSLTRLNALKQAVAFSTNIAAAIFFVFSGRVVWPVALVMAMGALLGGALGGRLAGRIKPSILRWMVVCIGVVVAVIYLLRG